jgi:hypothetical protein
MTAYLIASSPYDNKELRHVDSLVRFVGSLHFGYSLIGLEQYIVTVGTVARRWYLNILVMCLFWSGRDNIHGLINKVIYRLSSGALDKKTGLRTGDGSSAM